MAADPYLIAGVNLREFTANWLSWLHSGGGEMRGLLDELSNPKPDPDGTYFYGASFMAASIGLQAAKPNASSEELLLAAVLFIYQDAEFPGADPMRFDGFDEHVERAFGYFHRVGAVEAARRLRRKVIARSEPGPPVWEEIQKMHADRDPAKHAAHQRRMAELMQRELRAADLLDPEGDFDSEFLKG